MTKRAHIIIAALAALVGGILLFSSPLRAADPISLLCPNGQTVFIEGQSSPREALLIYLRGRAVGGGLAGADGRYSLPLRVQERPGIYPVEVRLRSSRALVAGYTCFVDVPLDTTLTPTPTVGAASPVPTPRTAPTAPTRSTAATATISPTRSAGSTTQPTAGTATTAGTTTTARTATTGATTSGTATVTRTPTTTTTTTPANTVEISDIVLRDPAFPDESEEYVQIHNAGASPINLAGWRLINASRSGEIAPYVFPSFTFDVDVTVAVFSAVGDDDLEIGDFFWDQTNDVWRVGDRAELRDAQNNLVATLLVPNQ